MFHKKYLMPAVIILFAAVILTVTHKDKAQSYETTLFDTSYVHQINIRIDEEDWQDLKTNALDKKKYHADITIDGECFENVSVSAKGAYSMRSIAENPDSDRYSLKIKLDKYEKEQTYYGLDTFDLINGVSDPSLTKDYIAYYMFRNMDVSAPLCSYAYVTVNDQPYGLFLSVEEIKDAFLNRNYDGQGMLYKPEAADLAEENEHAIAQIKETQENGTADQQSMRADVLSSLGEYTTGADLCYTTDDHEDYSDIFENAETDAGYEDEERVIQALKQLSEAISAHDSSLLSSCLNTDELLRYFAVHNFTNNYDSYTGRLNHNYYLYENNGRLELLPWDYDFFNCMSTDETALLQPFTPVYSVSADIDQPLCVSEDARPMWKWIICDDNYLKQYHELIDRFLKENLENGMVAAEIQRIHNMIRPYVEQDPTYLYSADEYEEAVKDLLAYCSQRTDSIRTQLNSK